MKLIKGSDLPEKLQEEVKKKFIYRLTVENGYPTKNPCKARVEPITDKEWLEKYAFWITKNEELSLKHKYCEPSYMIDK